jgi:sugar transferase (PEP-CTERM system associated)
VIRLFNVHYPARTIVLLAAEMLIIWTSFVLGTVLRFREDSFLVLNYEHGYYKILAVTVLALLCAHWGDLYDPLQCASTAELCFRLLLVLSCVCFLIAVVGYVFPHFMLGNHALLCGLIILALTLFAWRAFYLWLIRRPYMRERVYVVGEARRVQRLVEGLERRTELGIETVAWKGIGQNQLTSAALAADLMETTTKRKIRRVIVAFPDRRRTIPVRELLHLRLNGVSIEDSTTWLEKISGKIELDALYPSWLIFSDGFHISPTLLLLRRLISFIASVVLLILAVPIFPLVALAIKLSSPGPVLYRQKRVGRKGVVFNCYKFRTMQADAEADRGPTWAGDEDPRITRIGHFFRRSRLDELPQLWNVLRGDMGFVGPRPERPEFVELLTREIPYYPVRHLIRPGVTGWAQIRYKYGSSVADAKEKLQYDLFYLKNISLGLDALIMFQTVKIVLLGRGAQ